MGNKVTKIIIVVILISVFITEVITIANWLHCKNFNDYLHFYSVNRLYYLLENLHNDIGENVLVARFYHNKLTDDVVLFLQYYLRFFDVRFNASLISLSGYAGILLWLYYFFKQRKTKITTFFAAVFFILPIGEILINLKLSFILQILIFFVPFIFYSLWGIYEFMNKPNYKKFRISFIIILIIFSLWWLIIIPYAVPVYCVS
ncbi:MAG TPA: hypothetical protein VMR41_06070 [Patescibacteria group bacterium]|nr:hypothetical protein [Patescibacteria group bacterium]